LSTSHEVEDIQRSNNENTNIKWIQRTGDPSPGTMNGDGSTKAYWDPVTSQKQFLVNNKSN
jgi:hypothetical protein